MKNFLSVVAASALVTVLAACAPYYQGGAQRALAEGRLDDAANDVQSALSADPNNLQLKHLAAEIFTRRGRKEYDGGQMIAAQADFQRAVSYDPTYGPAYDYLGLIAFSEHDWGNAINYGQKAASLSGQSDPVYVQQAQQELRKVQSGGIKPYIGSRRRRHHHYDDNF